MKKIRKIIMLIALAFILSVTSTGVALAAGTDNVEAAESVTDAILAKPVINSVKNTTSGIQIKWKKNSKVTGYLIYRKVGNNSYKKIKTVKSASMVSFTDNKIFAGKTYYYKIVAYKTVSGKNKKSKPSAVKSIKYIYPGKEALAAYKKVAGKDLYYHFAAGYYAVKLSAKGTFKLTGGTRGATHWSELSGTGQLIKAKKISTGAFQAVITNMTGYSKGGWQNSDGVEETSKENLSFYNGSKCFLFLKGAVVPTSYRSDLSRYVSGSKAATNIFWIKDKYAIFVAE